MIIRPVDDNDDMMPVATLEDMASGATAVGEVIKANIELIRGEWWEDESLGTEVPQFVLDNARLKDVGFLQQYITKYIQSIEGVEAIDGVEVEVIGHQMKYKCIVIAEGEAESVEVNLDGLFGTQY